MRKYIGNLLQNMRQVKNEIRLINCDEICYLVLHKVEAKNVIKYSVWSRYKYTVVWNIEYYVNLNEIKCHVDKMILCMRSKR